MRKFKSKLVENGINQKIFCEIWGFKYSLFRGAINNCRGFRMKPEFQHAIDTFMSGGKPFKMPFAEIKKEIEKAGIKIGKNKEIIVLNGKSEELIFAFLSYVQEGDIPEDKFELIPVHDENYEREWYIIIITTRKYGDRFVSLYNEFIKTGGIHENE